MIEQSLGWAGNIFFIIGVYILGKKNVHGFWFNSIANGLYVIQSIMLNNQALFWLSVGLMFLNLKGIYEWNKNNV